MKHLTSKAVAALVTFATAATVAHAQPPVTELPASQNTCSLDDVKTLEMVSSIACAGRFNSVNDANSLPAILDYLNANFAAYGPWSHLGQSDPEPGDPSPFQANVEAENGTLLFDDPIAGYFGIILKSSTAISLYILDGGAGTGGVIFNTDGITGQELSHAGLWAGGTPTTTIPEPSTYLLMTAGLMAIGAVARRRRNS